ncbi:MAG TPA: phage portal protein [Caulobacterales bacterium]|nr:phage portal protein [Caulobacterales bacterium]
MSEARGIIGAISRAYARLTTPQPVDGYSVVTIGNAVAGVNLYDPTEALKVAAVWRCVNLLSDTIAMLPWQVFKRDGDNSERQGDNPVEWLLLHEANEEMSAFDFKKQLAVSTLTHGNGYAEIERTARGAPYALWPIDARRVTPGRLANGKLAYKVQQPGGQSIVIAAGDMFHMKGTSLDGVRGMSVLEAGARSIAAPLAMDLASDRFFSQGMRPSALIKKKGKYSDEQLKNIKEFFSKNYQGTANSWKPIFLDDDMDVKEFQANFEQAQFIDLRRFTVLEICRLFGVPPHMAYDLERATFSNIDAQGQDFLTFGLLPRIVPLEQEADRKLLTRNHGGLYSKMNANALVRGDMAARSAFYKAMSDVGAFSPNDILRLEDMNTFAGGDVRTKQSQYKDVSGAGADPPPATPPPPPKKANGAGSYAQ